MKHVKGTAGVVRTSHIGLCISDLAVSMRFYCDGLGFHELGRVELGQEVASVGQISGDVRLQSVFIGRETTVLEFLHYVSPGIKRPAGVKPMNETGLTHVAVTVEDVDRAVESLTKLGGTVIKESRTRLVFGDFVMLRDPDGARIELMKLDVPQPFSYPDEL